jgi:hypothetical protein
MHPESVDDEPVNPEAEQVAASPVDGLTRQRQITEIRAKGQLVSQKLQRILTSLENDRVRREAELARWNDLGFDENEKYVWRARGFAAEEAAAAVADWDIWTRLEVTAQLDWFEVDADELRAWLSCGVEPVEMGEWWEVVDSPAEAARWHTLGLRPAEANAWRDCGIGVAEAEYWHDAGVTSLKEVRE